MIDLRTPSPRVFMVLAFLCLLPSTLISLTAPVSARPHPVGSLEGAIDYDRVLEHVRYLSGLGSRVTGYPGSYSASRYISDVLKSYGLNVTVQTYKVVVPIDEGATITLLSPQRRTIKAHALWPNSVQTSPTPPEGVTGRLIYVGDGDLEDFDGKEVEGAIALMDFNSGDNWINAAKLGAKAVIFIEPPHTTYLQCMKKFLDTPVHFPRLYVTEADGLLLREASGNEVRVVSRMRYAEVTAENVIGIVNGTHPQDAIIVSSHYDSWSVVPALSTGANEAVSIAYLLELARYIKEQQPLRSVWFVAFSGHWQALAGAREFVERYYFGPEVEEGSFRPWMQINIGELASEGRALQLLRGSHYSLFATTDDAGGISLRYSWVLKQIVSYLSDPILREVVTELTGMHPIDYVREFFTNNMFWGTEAFPYLLDSEPAEIAGAPAFTISTSYCYKQWMGTPLSDIHGVDIQKLKPQMVVIAHLVNSFAKEAAWGLRWEDVAPRREITTVGVAEYSGFITIIGKVLAFNASVGWYNPVPRAMVRVHIDSPYPFAKIITLADEHGGFVVHGIAPTPYVPGNKWFIDAWVLDEETGAIQYAPDLGIYGAKQFAPFVSPLTHPTRSSIVVMKCVPVTLFDIIDPRTERTTMMPDPRLSGYWQGGGGWFYAGGGEVVPQDFVTRGDLLFYGAYYNNWEPLAMVFVPPEARFSILFRLGRPALGRPAMVLVNANEEFPEGQGFKAKGEALVITNTAYRAARDMVLMTNSRYERLKLRNVRSLSADERLAKADDYLAEAKECYGARAYGEAYRKALLAWSWVYRAYSGEVMPLIDDTSTSAFFFFLLIIPSALIIEKLVLHREGRGRLVSILGVGAVLLLIFSYIHPALTVMSISSMALLGATSLILFLLAALILADETERIIKSISLRLLGIHKVERGRVGVAMMSLSTSLENMRKRPFRAFLTLLTIISVAAAFTSLTSVTYYTTVKHVPLQREALYDGIFMKVGYATPPDGPLQMYLVDCAREVVKGKGSVFPRVWYYPPSISNPRIGVEAVISSEGGQASVKAAMGISHEEFALLFEEALSSGRGFIEGEYYACVLPRSIADALEVEVGDRVEVFGLELTVVGIIDTLVLTDVFDLDGFAPAPIDPLFVGSLGFDVVAPAQVAPPSLSLGRAVILPYKLALDLGGYVAAVSIRFPRGIAHEDLVQYSSELVTLLDTAVYVGWGGKVSKASRVSTYLAIGWEIIPVLVVIGAVNVGASILGNVKERGREIFVYSAVGLSPFGATIMYVTESIVYALLGSAIGYFIGFTLNSVLLQLNMLPADFAFNSASVFVIASLAAIVIAALASSSYPASVAAKLITPSLERRWKPPTKPKGDEWTIPLPLKIPSLEETVGLLEYLREYYAGAGAQRPAFTVRELALPLFKDLKMEVTVGLAPYELNVIQLAVIQAYEAEKAGEYRFSVYLKRLSGARSNWRVTSLNFMDDLRKQLLLWRSLPPEERRKCIERAQAAM